MCITIKPEFSLAAQCIRRSVFAVLPVAGGLAVGRCLWL